MAMCNSVAWSEMKKRASRRFLQTTNDPRTVKVRCSRERSRGNPIALFFRGITGHGRGDACSQSAVTANNQILGVRPFDGVSVPALPLAILKSDPSGLRADTWENHIINHCGCDDYRYNQETNTVEQGRDGIPEIELHSKKNDESALDANVQLVDLNTDLRTKELLEQFETGWTADALEDFGGEIVFHPGTHWMTSSATIVGDHAFALEQLIGEPRICLLYSELLPSGNDGYGNLRVTDLVAGRIMAVRHNSDGRHVLVFQPTVLTTKTAVLAESLMDLTALIACGTKTLGKPLHLQIAPDSIRTELLMVAQTSAEQKESRPQTMEDRQAFQKLKTRIHRRMVDAIDLSKAGQLQEAELREQLRNLARAHLLLGRSPAALWRPRSDGPGNPG